ncbi:hypothetical protein EUTSA_v10015738mg [Eutrema salsugineum]|uniref:F-box domain-containing protein n=1 Tax=Eutrema salsugineum TaxID=72664 RepID=V4LJV8_EUTSA|nr:putative F-box/FBD/LRR-repeat protein At5g56810 [Eutrema salsugineum]ESQ42737.1 hypothetical protein EUTSA_v10015738mg [Eutrema salsugineum]
MKTAKLGTEDATFPDRISRLPNDLLFQILSLVTITDAMKTSLLSKRWKSVWKMMPMLDYDKNSCPNIGSLGFVEFCRRSLQLHDAPVVKTLNLKLGEHAGSMGSLKFLSFQNNLRVFQKLVFLKLDTIVLEFSGSPPRTIFSGESPVCFPSLRSLHLTNVTFKWEESFCRLVSACSVLEDLFLEGFCRVAIFLFTISVPSLQRLSIITEPTYCLHNDPTFEMNTPSLNYLKIIHRRGCFSFVEDMPNLVEANVLGHLVDNVKLLKVLTCVERLSIDLYPVMMLHLADGLIFNRLLHLEIDTFYDFRSNSVLHFLKHFPALRALKLNHSHRRIHINIEYPPDLYSEPSSVPECLSFHLETLQWIGYERTLEERESAVYIQKNAHRLKTATFSLRSTITDHRMLMIKDLRCMTKASASCQLVIKF